MISLGPARSAEVLAAAGETRSSLERALALHEQFAVHYERRGGWDDWLAFRDVITKEIETIKGRAP